MQALPCPAPPHPVLPDLSPNHLLSGIINGIFIDLFFNREKTTIN